MRVLAPDKKRVRVKRSRPFSATVLLAMAKWA